MKDFGKVAVICGGVGSEREISLRTGNAIFTAIKNSVDASLIEFDSYTELFNNETFIECDLVFIALHGWGGEDGRLQGYLDLIGKKYTGSMYEPSAIAMDKTLTKSIARKKCIRSPFGETANSYKEYVEVLDLLYKDIAPEKIVVKPNKEGSSVGLHIFNTKEEAIYKGQDIDFSIEYLIEEFVTGREITIPVLAGVAYPIVEIVADGGVYDYAHKYTKGASNYICPAKFEQTKTEKLQKQAEQIYAALNCNGIARVDFIIGTNEDYFLEINTIPGMTETSLAPMSAQAININFTEFCLKILESTKGTK